MKRVVIVSGAVGVGKSAALLAMREALADRVSDVAVLETDAFYMMIDPHWTMPAARVERYFEISGWLLRETALGFLRGGFDWVAIGSNGLWRESHVRDFAGPFGDMGAEAHHVTLDPGDEVTLGRIRARGRVDPDGPEVDLDEAVEMLAAVRGGAGPWTHVIDNRAMTPDETALAIFDAVAAGNGRL